MTTHVNWTYEETKALLSVWSEENIQSGLGESVRNEKVYGEVSRRLAAMEMFRSAKQCRDKIKKLKLEYRRIQKYGGGRGDLRTNFRWYDTLDSILSGTITTRDDSEESDSMIQKFVISDIETNEATASEVHTSYSNTLMDSHATVPTQYPPVNKQEPDYYPIQVEDSDGPSTSARVLHAPVQTSIRDTRWSKKEVQALLTLWANPAVQDELTLNVRNNQVYARLSATLQSLGFSKTPQKCREKIKKLKQDYKRMKHGEQRNGRQRTTTTVWFSIMDAVLGSRVPAWRDPKAARLSQKQSPMEVDSDVEAQWMPDEVQVLMTLWAQPNIQKQLLNPALKTQVFKYLSSELKLVGFNKTPQQCSHKVSSLKEEYRKIKEEDLNGSVQSNWFAILDGVLGSDGAASPEMDSSAAVTQTKSSEYEHEKDTPRAVWTSDEVKVLLTRWAEESVQEQLRCSPTNERVFAQLSSDLATQGFDKTTSQCRTKIRLLREKYRVIKEQNDSRKPRGRWFAVMDKVLSWEKQLDETKRAWRIRNSVASSLQTLQEETVEDFDCSLSVSSLCLLVPTLRLMCAFAWHVVQRSNVMQYGKVEELVRTATELAPELLTSKEKVQILLKLRARLVLELCRSESTASWSSIQPHLAAIKSLTMDSTRDQEESEDLEKSKSNFVEVVERILQDTEERKIFFKEVFPIHYGQQFQATLKALVWKFISRLDHLMPVPDIKQTAEWLSGAPSVVEECEHLVLRPDQMKELLSFHQQRTGFTNKGSSQTQNIFLPRLSLPPKPNKQLHLENLPAYDEDDGLFYYSEDEESPDDVTPTQRVCIEGDEVKDLRTENCSNFSPSGQQTSSLCSSTDSQATGKMQHTREVDLIQDPGRLQSRESKRPNIVQKAGDNTFNPENKGAGFTCEYCGKFFRFISSLKDHIKTHTLPFHCDKCDKKYASMSSLHLHRMNHTGETPFLCSYCGRGFKTAHSLSAHVPIHTGERRYKCHICGKTSIQHMSRHMRMHRGEKNYLCTECGKAFLSSGELKLHTRSHTGERPYTCKHCDKTFIAKCFLTVHMRRHTGECPYKCTVCPKAFHTLRGKKTHMKIHTDLKSFQCLKCGKIFRQEETYKAHIQTHTD
ncbi:uncharacterized protein LOC141810533 [Halichoeres trimaculatus]|uniref:uncharacterized protein LOC141810533 n=1 Tax=Halichoeres trimaculatus TaxID=147232 RepID=UPI003D9E039D